MITNSSFVFCLLFFFFFVVLEIIFKQGKSSHRSTRCLHGTRPHPFPSPRPRARAGTSTSTGTSRGRSDGGQRGGRGGGIIAAGLVTSKTHSGKFWRDRYLLAIGVSVGTVSRSSHRRSCTLPTNPNFFQMGELISFQSKRIVIIIIVVVTKLFHAAYRRSFCCRILFRGFFWTLPGQFRSSRVDENVDQCRFVLFTFNFIFVAASNPKLHVRERIFFFINFKCALVAGSSGFRAFVFW
mmetsp:Transcript_27108/g.45403  ORF Transcript_27108/g.45403 Transcript_27108/m.45403 type:complete len:239 (-) Transcript_27108:188-904(-)